MTIYYINEELCIRQVKKGKIRFVDFRNISFNQNDIILIIYQDKSIEQNYYYKIINNINMFEKINHHFSL